MNKIKILVKHIVLKLIPNKIYTWIKDEVLKEVLKHANLSFSQEGEDMVLRRIFGKQNTGYYVDVGAHHPKRFSNTYYFYNNGWRGINIDAMPGSMSKFNKIRAEDINIECPISDKQEVLSFFMFNEPALNSFYKKLSLDRDANTNYSIQHEVKLQTSTLSDMLNKYLPKEQKIDFLSVDVEGFDLNVLKSNDWTKYRPEYVLVEDISNTSLKNIIANGKTYEFLISHGYELIGKTFYTLFFKNIKLIRNHKDVI